MCIQYDTAAFFKALRKHLTPRLTQSQVNGINAILAAYEEYGDKVSTPQLAYCFATAYHETATTMLPVKEYGGDRYFFDMYDPQGRRPKVAKALGNTQPGDGVRFCGRGYVQLTGRRNYALAGEKLGVDLVSNPELARDPEIAAKVMFIGMEEGWFTGLTLDRTIDNEIDGDEYEDFVQARRIINGTDKAAKIAKEADAFLKALKVSTIKQ